METTVTITDNIYMLKKDFKLLLNFLKNKNEYILIGKITSQVRKRLNPNETTIESIDELNPEDIDKINQTLIEVDNLNKKSNKRRTSIRQTTPYERPPTTPSSPFNFHGGKKVYTGKRGGKYILVNGQKRYLSNSLSN